MVLTLPVSDRGELPTAWRPVGRALESEAPPWPGVPPVPSKNHLPTPNPGDYPHRPEGRGGPGSPTSPGLGLAFRHWFPKPRALFFPGSSSPFPCRAGQLASPLELSEPCLQTWIMTSRRINCEYVVTPSPTSAGASGLSGAWTYQFHRPLLLSRRLGLVL